MKKKIALSLCVSVMVFLLAGPLFAQTYTGKITRITITLIAEDGKSRTFTVKGNVNLNNVDPGDKVRIIVKNKEITFIEVVEEDDDD